MQAVETLLVGVGHLGRYHLQKLLRHDRARLRYVVEPAADRRAFARAESYRVLGARADDVSFLPSMACLPAFCGRPGTPRAAVVAAPTPQHLALGAACLRHGYHVLLEKPLAATAEEARRLLALAAQHRRLLYVGHLERFNPALVAVRPWLSAARYVVVERLGSFSGRSTDTDVVLDLMVHDLDLVAMALAQEVTEVRAVGVPILTQAVDMASARLVFAGGAVAQLSAGRVSLEPCRKLRFFTPERYVSVDCLRNEVKAVRRLPPQRPGERPTVAGDPVWLPPADGSCFGAHDPLGQQTDAFLRAVLATADAGAAPTATGADAPLATGADGLRAVALAEAVKDAFQPWPGEASTGVADVDGAALAAAGATAAPNVVCADAGLIAPALH